MSNDWFLEFPDSRIINQPIIVSDHAAIIFNNTPPTFKKSRPYQIENWCLKFSEVTKLIEEDWRQTMLGSPMFMLCRKLVILRMKIRKWCLDNKTQWGVN